MVYDDYRLFVLLLTTSSIVAGLSEETCNIYALIGHNLTLPLDHKMPSNKDTLRWTHDGKVIFTRASGLVRLGKPTDVDADGSLRLLDLRFSSAGDYRANVNRQTGWSGRVCVFEKVSTPVLTFLCDSSGTAATLSCSVHSPRHVVVFAWTREGQLLTGETKPTLSVSLAEFKGDKGFSCSVSNKASEAQSKPVRFKCEPPPKVYCFKASTVMAAVAGGVGLILLLFVITVLVACSQQKEVLAPERRENLPMVLAKKSLKTGNDVPDYEVMHPSGDTPGPPSPRLSHGPSPTVYSQALYHQ